VGSGGNLNIAIVHPRTETIEYLQAIAGRVPIYRVIWVAEDGRQAIAKEVIQPPDLLLIAIALLDLDAIEVIRRILSRSPKARIAIKDDLARDNAHIFEVMRHRLLYVVDLSEKLANILGKTATIGRLLGAPIPCSTAFIPRISLVIAIGASTGGPVALATILSAFPEDFGATIIIVPHLNPEFLPGLVAWLDRQTPLPIAIAQEGDYLEAGKVLLANTGNHLRLTENSRVTYSRNSSERLYCPSILSFDRCVFRPFGRE
jgi:two-component system, chemotaxis family, response regulator WspF